MTDYIFGAMIASGGPNNQGLLGANGRISTTTLFANTANIGVANIASVSFTNLSVGNAITFGDGTVLQTAASSVSVYNYTGNGVTTTFATGNQSATSVNATMVFIGGVYQRKNQYTWIGTNIIFNAAPPVATNIEIQVSTAATNILVPNDASVTPAKLSTGGPSWDVYGNLTVSSNLAFSGTANRITGDMSNATFSSRLAFQTSTTNGITTISTLPNGTATTSQYRSYNAADPTNASLMSVGIGATEMQLQSAIRGTGTYLPMTFYTGGSERMRITSTGNVGINTTSVTSKTYIYQDNTTAYGLISQTPVVGLTAGNYVNMAYFTNARSTNNDGLRIVNVRDSTGSGVGNWETESYRIRRSVDQNDGATGVQEEIVFGQSLLTFNTAGGERMRILASGNVAIGQQTAPLTFTVAGDIAATRNVFSNYSDLRLKTKVGDIESALDKVEAIDTLYYEPNQTALDLGAGTGRSVGVSAQSVQEVMPETIGPSPLDTQYMTVQYERLVPLLIAAIKELRAEVRQLRSGA